MNLPLIKTFEDAAGLAADHQDDFYIYLFLIRAWIGELFLHAVATYSVNKDPRNRSMQTEQAWARLSRVFRRQPEKYLPFFFDSIARYSKEFDDEFSMFTRQAISSLTLHESLQDQPLTIRHLCSWLDSIIHLHIHELSHTGPVCFDPDPDKRDLALLGVAQRHLAESSQLGNEAWSAVFSHSIRRFQNSSKWRKLGQAMASAQQHPWTYREVDTAIISLWPLLKHHNWTYRDLMNVTRSLISRPNAYPCGREQDFVVHCRTVLGLRKTGRGKSSKDGHPPAHEIARELFAVAIGGMTPPTNPSPSC